MGARVLKENPQPPPPQKEKGTLFVMVTIFAIKINHIDFNIAL